MVPQPRSPTQTNVADETASTGVDVRHGGATTTVTSLDAAHGNGIFDKTPTMPHDSPLPRVYTLISDEGRMQHNELMDLVTKLSDKIGRKIAEIHQDPDISLVQHDVEVQGRHEHDMELDFEFTTAEEVYTTEKEVSTTKPVSTAGASVSTAGASLAKDKGKAIMEEAETIQTKTKSQLEQERLGYEEALRLQAKIDEEERQRIARVQEEANSFNIEEWDDIQARVEFDEEFAYRLQSEEIEMYSEAEKARLLAKLINERKRYFAAQRAEERRNKPLTQNLFETTMRRVHTFVPIESESERVILELAAESSKRDAEEELVQESSKRQKIGESSQQAKEPDELSQEELQQMMRIVPEKGMNKEYPLSRGTLALMLVAKLMVEQDNEMSRKLLRKIFMQVERPRR
ncbi:hypothetical protein Tco_1412420 [Tanacetum coccineum]